MPRVKIGPAIPDRKSLDVEIARLRDLDVGDLRIRLKPRSRNGRMVFPLTQQSSGLAKGVPPS